MSEGNAFDYPVKQWYAEMFEDDPIVNDMPYLFSDIPGDALAEQFEYGTFDRDAPITFADYATALRDGIDVYKLMGYASDSIVRERIFERLSQLIGVEYDAIYNMWLHSS